jgi:hypothetical protein
METFLRSITFKPGGEVIVDSDGVEDEAGVLLVENQQDAVAFASSAAVQFLPLREEAKLTGEEIGKILGATVENPIVALDWRIITDDARFVQILAGFRTIPVNPSNGSGARLHLPGVKLFYRRIIRGNLKSFPTVRARRVNSPDKKRRVNQLAWFNALMNYSKNN